MPPRALLLDFDGVIADTQNVHIASWQRTFGAMGWEVADEVCARSLEVDDRLFLADLFERRKILDGNVEGWVRRKQDLTHSLLTDSPRVFPGVVELVERVKGLGSVKLAVVSTTWRANIVTVLKAVDIYSSFSLIVGKEDVKSVKPDPEAYQLAVKSLGLRPDEAVALEDSASGLAAAGGAGIRVVVVRHLAGNDARLGRHTFLPDLRETDEVLKALGLA